ncbi:MAG TPA: hypothetical protein VFK02_04090 [Kofleriaceae bacterium]|nr:hypothetical protein [Kofleriaceae bacterium]
MSRAWLVAALLLLGGVARADRPAAAPPPDGPGVRNRPIGTDNRRMVGVLEVRVTGLSDEVRDSFQRQLEDLIDNKRYRLADHGYLKKAMTRSTRWTDGCLVGRCLAELHAQAGADLILLAALTGSGTNFGYVVTLIRTDTGRVVDQESDRCDVCTVSEVMSRATLAAVGLLNNAPDKLPDEAAEQTATIQRAADASRRELAAHDRHTTRIGIALLVIGLVGAAAGGAMYLLDDSHPTYSVATAAGGAAMATGGIIVLTF